MAKIAYLSIRRTRGFMGQHHDTTYRGLFSRAALVFGLLVVLWPATSHAAVGRCMEVSDLADQGVETFILSGLSVEQTGPKEAPSGELTDLEDSADSPCGGDADADPSSNLCFEDADGQISTLPRLLAQWRGQQAAGAVVDSVLAAVDRAEANQPEALAEASVEPPAMPAPSDGDSCSTNPDECRALPPLAPTVVIDVSTTPARAGFADFDIPVRLSDDDTRAWARLRVGPRLGHRDPPDQPPRA